MSEKYMRRDRRGSRRTILQPMRLPRNDGKVESETPYRYSSSNRPKVFPDPPIAASSSCDEEPISLNSDVDTDSSLGCRLQSKKGNAVEPRRQHSDYREDASSSELESLEDDSESEDENSEDIRFQQTHPDDSSVSSDDWMERLSDSYCPSFSRSSDSLASEMVASCSADSSPSLARSYSSSSHISAPDE